MAVVVADIVDVVAFSDASSSFEPTVVAVPFRWCLLQPPLLGARLTVSNPSLYMPIAPCTPHFVFNLH